MTNTIQHKRSSTPNNPPDSLEAGEIAINTSAGSANIHFEDAAGSMRSVGADPPAEGTYFRQITSAGEAGSWASADSVPGTGDGSGDFGFWSRDDDTDTLTTRTTGDDLRIEGQFTASRANQTDAVQVIPTAGSAQSSTLQVVRGDAGSGNLPAFEVVQNGNTNAQIQFDGQTILNDVTLTRDGGPLTLTGSDATDSRTIALRAPSNQAAFGANYTLTLPTSAGANGQVLTTNGTGTLSWTNAGDGMSQVDADLRYLRVDNAAGDQSRVSGGVTFENESRLDIRSTISVTTGDYYGYQAILVSNTTADTITGFLASATLGDNKGSADRAYGFQSNIAVGSSATPNYGFYASGTGYHWLSGRTALGSTHGAHPSPPTVLHVKSGDPEVMRVERFNNLNAAIGFTNNTGNMIYCGSTVDSDFAVHRNPELNDPGALLTVYRQGGKVEVGNPTASSGVAHSLMVEGRLGCDAIRPYTGGSANVVIASNGLLQMASSSARLKTDIETMQDAYADKVVDECRPVFYRPNPETADPDEEFDPTKSYWGFIAEEVEQVDPRLVWYGKDEEGNDRVDGVAYDSFAPILLNVVKRQRDQIADLEARLSALEAAASGGATTSRKRKS